MKPLAIFGGIVVVGLAVIFGGLRLTAHSASADNLPAPLGSYATSVRIVADTTAVPALPIGYSSLGTWTFVRHCSSSGCTTNLLRPSIIPGTSRVFLYALRPITNGYQGTLNIPDVCSEPTQTLPPGAIVDHEVLTIRPTRMSAGKVAAFNGTMVIKYVVAGWAKAEGCNVNGSQTSSINSPA